jgi:serine protease Do
MRYTLSGKPKSIFNTQFNTMSSLDNPAPPAVARPLLPPSRPPNRLPLLLLLLLGVILLAFLPVLIGQIEYARTRAEVRALNDALPETNLKALSKAFTLIYRKVKPSVVHIDTHRGLNARRSSLDIGTIFGGTTQQYDQQGEASGVIVDEAGYIVTNLHVVKGAPEVSVVLENGQRYTAEVIGIDPAIDLAVLKIDAKNLTAAQWGDSSKLEVGEMVWAIGSPFGLDQTVTAGIVSAIGRHEDDQGPKQDLEFLQTDVAINPGSSGGPLVDIEGNVVGINAAILGSTYQGISFAIPSNQARKAYEQIRARLPVIRGYLGVNLKTVMLTDARFEQLPAGQTTVVLVNAVSSGSPAEKAHILPNDIILQWNNKPVSNEEELVRTVAQSQVGKMVPVLVYRNGKELTLNVEVMQRPAQLEDQ